ncbi:hypothetical protein Droror1_Dr00017478 [Drosera rotundifolia]
MAPTRKRGTSKGVKTSEKELSLGDLVLAKVKGFPAWPAKVSRPEDWERTPDPKKYFVQFYGTQEIAFVAPSDIQTFTHESKSKLLARCQGKTVRYFAQAVKEICEAFEGLPEMKLDGSDNDSAQKAIHSDGSSAKGVENAVENEIVDGRSHLVRCSNLQVKHDHKDKTLESHAGKHGIRSPVSLSDNGHGSKSSRLGIGSKRKLEDSVDQTEALDSSLNLKEAKTRKIVSGIQQLSPNTHISEHLKAKVAKNLTSERKKLDAPNSLKDVALISNGHADGDRSNLIKSGPLDLDKLAFDESKRSVLVKPKHVDSVNHSSRLVALKNGESNASASIATGKMQNNIDRIISKTSLGIEYTKGDIDLHAAGGEGHLPLVKRQRKELRVVSDAANTENEISMGINKTDLMKKRRAIRLSDEDDEDEQETPVSGHVGSKVNKSSSSDLISHINGNHVSSDPSGHSLVEIAKRTSTASPEENILPAKSPSKPFSPAPALQRADVSRKAHSRNSCELVLGKVFCDETESALISPKRSPQAGSKFVEEGHIAHSFSPRRSPQVIGRKAAGDLTKGPDITAQTKNQSRSVKTTNVASDRLNISVTHASMKKSKQHTAVDISKGTPTTNSLIMESVASAKQRQNDSSFGGRGEDIKERISSSADVKTSKSAVSIKDLIAAAKNVQAQSSFHGHSGSVLIPSAHIHAGSPTTLVSGKPLMSGLKTAAQLGLQESHAKTSDVSPSSHDHELAPNHLDSGDHEDRRTLESARDAGVPHSGGTDAAVDRDAFEGMIETLSRTKESIGRATRLAIDCAKHGVAQEIVDFLIQKLENEPSFHRRVDLLFLMDSITQCSHSQKGVAGASYIPAVQAALPRLLSAAAPPGAAARENRRQCLKVLRLWAERKILPESVLRRFMDDIGASIDDANIGISSRRPSRSERGVDDPLRDLESDQFDEYGSNANFQMDGFFPTRRFNDDEDEEEDVPSSSYKRAADSSPLHRASPKLMAGRNTPGDKHHHILEDVDVELEMEDVSGHPKDEKPSTIGSSRADIHECYVDGDVDMVSTALDESSLPWSPPLPLEPPPPLPPLPSSPPPPPPLHSQLLPPSAPPPYPIQAPLPPQSSQPLLGSHLLSQHSNSLPSSSTPLAFQIPGNGFSSLHSGNQPMEMLGNRLQRSSSFISAGMAAPVETTPFGSSRSLDYGHNDSSQAAQSNQQFQPGHPGFAQAPIHQMWPPQTPVNHYPSNKLTASQNLQYSYIHSYSSPPLPDGRMGFASEEHWRGPSGEYTANRQHRTWMNGARSHTSSTAAFGEGYFRTPADGPFSNGMGFQHFIPHHPPVVGPAAGQNTSQRFPSRSDMSTSTRWTPR